MQRVAVLTDSSSDLEPFQAEQLGIHLLLLAIQFDGRDWLDHMELDSDLMFTRMKAGVPDPVLRLPSINHFFGVLDNLLSKHDHVFAIHTSPLIGKVYGFVLKALEVENWRERVTLFDSRTTSIGMALQAERAVRLLRAGLPLGEVVEVLTNVQGQQTNRLSLTTLEYLRRARIRSGPAALLGELQGKKPLFDIQDGRLKSLGLYRSDGVACKLWWILCGRKLSVAHRAGLPLCTTAMNRPSLPCGPSVNVWGFRKF